MTLWWLLNRWTLTILWVLAVVLQVIVVELVR